MVFPKTVGMTRGSPHIMPHPPEGYLIQFTWNHRVPRAKRKNKPQSASTFQAAAETMFSTCPITKSRHGTKPRVNVTRDRRNLWIQEGMNKLGALTTVFNHIIPNVSFCVVKTQLCTTPGFSLPLYSLIPGEQERCFFLEICIGIKQAYPDSSSLISHLEQDSLQTA